MKKIVLSAMLVLVVSGISIFLYRLNYSAVGFGTTDLPLGDNKQIDHLDLSKDPLISNLNDQVFSLISINTAGFIPVSRAFSELGSAFDRTKLAQINGSRSISSLIIEEFKKSFEERAGSSTVLVRDVIFEIWQLLSAINLIISSNTFTIDGKLNVPYIWINGVAQDGRLRVRLQDLIDAQFAENENVIKTDALKILRTTTEKQSEYSVEFYDDKKIVVSGLLRIDDNSANIFFGTDKPDVFLKAEDRNAFINSPKLRSVYQGVVDGSALIFYYDFESMVGLLNQVRAMLPKNQEELAEILNAVSNNQLNEMIATLISVSFQDGALMRQCSSAKPGTFLAEYFAAAVKVANTKIESGERKFSDLLGRNTMLAFQFNAPLIKMAVHQLDQTYGARSPAAATANDDAKLKSTFEEISAAAEKILSFLDRVNFTEIGLRINSATGTPIPDAMIYLGGSSIGALEALSALRELIISIPPSAAIRQEIEQRMAIVNNNSPQAALQIVIKDNFKIIVSTLSAHSLAVSFSGPFIGTGKVDLESAKSEPLLDSYPMSQAYLSSALSSSDCFTYLNLRSIFELSRPYLPFLIARQPESMPNKLKIEDIDELFDLFGVSVFASQRTHKVSENSYCVDGVWKIIK